MKSLVRKKLRKLLLHHASNELALRCLTALQDKKSSSHLSTGPLPVHHLRRIYKRRASVNKRGQTLIEGLGELISSLKATTYDVLEIHTIEAGKEVFSIFTDQSVTSLIGILVSKNKAG